MYILKGFINIDALANNTPGSISALGELSNVSSTFSVEKGYYQRDGYPNIELVSFASRYDSGARITVPAKYSDHVCAVTQWMFTQALQNKFTDNVEAFQRLLLQQFGASISDLEYGKMVTAKGSWLPSYIAWRFEQAGEENQIRIWFSDEAFRAQYDEYQIVVIPPIEPIDIFMKTKTVVSKALENFNLPDHHKKVIELTGGEPYTYLVTNDYPWYDREDVTATLMTSWTVAIYGAAGNNLELIKKALADYILAHSAYSRQEWLPVFPDIFTNTEFTIVPMWHLRSVPDETPRGALYSPLVPYDGLPALVKKFAQYAPDSHLTKNILVGGIAYKSLAMVVVGSPENRFGKYKFTDIHPKYTLISTTSMDFGRMPADTVEFIQKLVGATIAAEMMDEYSYVGQNYVHITRNGVDYVGFSHGDINYLVVSRLSLGKVLGVNVG